MQRFGVTVRQHRNWTVSFRLLASIVLLFLTGPLLDPKTGLSWTRAWRKFQEQTPSRKLCDIGVVNVVKGKTKIVLSNLRSSRVSLSDGMAVAEIVPVRSSLAVIIRLCFFTISQSAQGRESRKFRSMYSLLRTCRRGRFLFCLEKSVFVLSVYWIVVAETAIGT